MYVAWVQNAIRSTFEYVCDKANIAASRQKIYYDKGLKQRSYKIGESVWRWYPPAINNKVGQGWTGPYLVVGKVSDITYEIQRNEANKSINILVDHLKQYTGKKPISNWLDRTEEADSLELTSATPVGLPRKTRRDRTPRLILYKTNTHVYTDFFLLFITFIY